MTKIYVVETVYKEYGDPEGYGDEFISETRIVQYDLDEFKELLRTHSGSELDMNKFYCGYHQTQYYFNGDRIECMVFDKVEGS